MPDAPITVSVDVSGKWRVAHCYPSGVMIRMEFANGSIAEFQMTKSEAKKMAKTIAGIASTIPEEVEK